MLAFRKIDGFDGRERGNYRKVGALIWASYLI
jgi:hypothetical protein